MYSGLLTGLGSVFSVIVQGDEALRFFVVALPIDMIRDLLMQWFLLWNRPGAIKPQCRPRLCRCEGEQRFIWHYHDLFSELIRPPPHLLLPPFHRLWLLSRSIAYCNSVSFEVPEHLTRKICHSARRTKSAAEASSESEWEHGSILEMT